MKNIDTLTVLYGLLIALFAILMVLITPLILGSIDSRNYNSTEDVADSCMNKGLQDSASCVLDITKGFYKYNIDNADEDLTFEELKKEGGVCSSWSEYYSDIGESLGFHTKNVIFPLSGNIYHEFSVWGAEDSYCVLDQTEVM